MLDKMKQLMEVKHQVEQLKRQLENTTLQVTEIPGIKIAINGAQKFQSIEIDKTFLSADNKAKLERDLLNAINAAVNKSQNAATQKMRDMTGLNIPGF